MHKKSATKFCCLLSLPKRRTPSHLLLALGDAGPSAANTPGACSKRALTLANHCRSTGVEEHRKVTTTLWPRTAMYWPACWPWLCWEVLLVCLPLQFGCGCCCGCCCCCGCGCCGCGCWWCCFCCLGSNTVEHSSEAQAPAVHIRHKPKVQKSRKGTSLPSSSHHLTRSMNL